MEKIYDYLEGKTLYDAFNELLDKQKVHDLIYISEKYVEGYEEEKVDQVYSEYSMNKNKSEYLNTLSGLDDFTLKKFHKAFLYIDSFDLDLGRKLEVILSLSVLFSKIPVAVRQLNNDELYLVGSLFTSVPASKIGSKDNDQFDLYAPVFCNDKLLKEVISKTDNMNQRRDMLRELFDYCDYCVSANMKTNDYNDVMDYCFNHINDIEITNKKGKVA